MSKQNYANLWWFVMLTTCHIFVSNDFTYTDIEEIRKRYIYILLVVLRLSRQDSSIKIISRCQQYMTALCDPINYYGNITI